MEQIPSPIQRSWARLCACGAAWRFYEEDIEVVIKDGRDPESELYITCPACTARLRVAALLRYSIRNRLAVAAIRAKRETEHA